MAPFFNSRLSTFVSSTILVLAAAACSGGGGGGGAAPLAPLTPAQMAQLDLTAKNVSQVSDWQTETARTAKPAFSMSMDRPSDAAKADIQKSVFDPAVCAVNVLQPAAKTPGADPTQPLDMNTELGVSIQGAGCPIAYSWSSKTTQKMDSQSLLMNMDFLINYAGRSAQAQAFDVESYRLGMNVSFTANKDGGSGTVSGSGEIVSRSQGKITIAVGGGMQMAQENMTSTIVVRMAYPDGLVVEFKNVSTQNAKSRSAENNYFINGVSVSESTFKQYSNSFGMDKAQSQSANSRR